MRQTRERTSLTKTQRVIRVATLVLAAGVALVAASCGSTGASTTGSSTPPAHVTQGGTLVLGANQEPGCADWLAACGNNIWGIYMMATQTLPGPFIVAHDHYTPSPLLAGEPTLDTGPPHRVIYRINPKAVWSDGQPITSTDFRFTYEQAPQTVAMISGVDDSDPHSAVVTYAAPRANWRLDLGFILPSHILRGKDRNAEMRNGYSFSGGPWIIDHWTRGQEVKLVRNPSYWGKKPNLDAVVFRIITDSSAYLAAYKTGQLDMIDIPGAGVQAHELTTVAKTHVETALGLGFEALHFNTQKQPLDSVIVRQALAYASDRNAIATQLLGPLLPGIKPTQAYMSPANRAWYSEPFKRYTRDLSMVTRLMTSDSWSRGPDGVWTKAGARAVIEIATTAGNQRRELAEQILQSQWKEAGFDTTFNNGPASSLYPNRIVKGDFQAALFAEFPSNTDPAICGLFCSRFIPTQANGFLGQNITRIASSRLDDTWMAAGRELDPNKRVRLVDQAQQALADEVPVLPLLGLVDVIAYSSAKVGGPVTLNPTNPFYNLNEWYCKAGCRQQS